MTDRSNAISVSLFSSRELSLNHLQRGWRRAPRPQRLGPRAADQREHAADQRQREQSGACIAEAALRAGADRQPPRDRRRPETVGQVIARCEDADRIYEPEE